MGSCWPRKKSNLLDSHENEAQDKKNLGAKDVAKGYMTPKGPNESRIAGKRSFNFSCLNNHSKNLVKVEVLASYQRWPHQCWRIPPSEASTIVKGLKLVLGSVLRT
jgi:hypothetical protein